MPNFLEGIMSSIGNLFGGGAGEGGGGGGGGSSAFNTLVSAATGGFKGRPQWKDLSFMNDAQNRLWPDEIKRQGQFLEGQAPYQGRAMEELAPYQARTMQTLSAGEAQAHNTFQDATYQQDTQRQTGRINEMAQGLNMSPWEITGSGGVTPVPSSPSERPQQGSQSQGQNPMPAFLNGLIPLQTAKMGNQTSLQIARMQNQTQRYIADQATGKGGTAKAQIAQTQAQTLLTESQAVLTGAQTTAARNGTFITNLRLLLDALPNFNTGVPGAQISGKSGTGSILEALKKVPGTGYDDNDAALQEAIAKLPDDRWSQLKGELQALGKGVKETYDTAKGYLADVLEYK